MAGMKSSVPLSNEEGGFTSGFLWRRKWKKTGLLFWLSRFLLIDICRNQQIAQFFGGWIKWYKSNLCIYVWLCWGGLPLNSALFGLVIKWPLILTSNLVVVSEWIQHLTRGHPIGSPLGAWSSGVATLIQNNNIIYPPEVYHSRWKMMLGRRSSPFGMVYFQGLCSTSRGYIP